MVVLCLLIAAGCLAAHGQPNPDAVEGRIFLALATRAPTVAGPDGLSLPDGLIANETLMMTRRADVLLATSAGPVLLLRPETRIIWRAFTHAMPLDASPVTPTGSLLPSRASLTLESGSLSLLADHAPSPTAWAITVPQGTLAWETGYFALTVNPAETTVSVPLGTRVRWQPAGDAGPSRLLPAGFRMRIGFLPDSLKREPLSDTLPVATHLRRQAERLAVTDAAGNPDLRLTYPATRFTRRPLNPDRLDPPAWTPILQNPEAPPALPVDLDP
ncbi:MAG: hypothetical protein ACFE0O_08030 [Opitutales bacterium]